MTYDSLPLAQSFHADLHEDLRSLSWDIGYQPTLFTDLMSRTGALAAVRRALAAGRPSEGFWVLHHHGLLHRSVEAWALRPAYLSLFTESERAEARRRLEESGFPVDAYVYSFGVAR
jgi:hypothetical protein